MGCCQVQERARPRWQWNVGKQCKRNVAKYVSKRAAETVVVMVVMEKRMGTEKSDVDEQIRRITGRGFTAGFHRQCDKSGAMIFVPQFARTTSILEVEANRVNGYE